MGIIIISNGINMRTITISILIRNNIITIILTVSEQLITFGSSFAIPILRT
jgi:hypothetical protein